MGGHSKKVTVGYKYYLGMHMVLCHGPVDSILQARCDKRIAWGDHSTGQSLLVDNEGLFGGESREGGVSGTIDADLGEPTQTQNDYLLSVLGSDIPAFRGVVSAIFRRLYIGMNPYLKPWDFKVQRVKVRQNGLTQWYPDKSGIHASIRYYVNLLGAVPCTSAGPICTCVGSVSDSLTTIATDKANFTLKARVRGVTELTIYSGGTHIGGYLYKDATSHTPTTYTKAYIDVSSPAAKYYLNHDPTTAETNVALDYTVSIPVNKGATVSLVVVSEDGYQNYNGGSLTVDDSDIYNPVRVTQSYDGQFYQLDGYLVYDDVGIDYDHVDMNPVHIIRECLTDPDWGMGYPESDIDATTFEACADTLYIERMGISLLWDRQIPIEDFISEIIRHINAVLYIDRTTGKFTLKLIRDDYTVGSLLTLDETNIQSVNDYSRIDQGESINTVVVNFWNHRTGETESVTADDLALIQSHGNVVATTIQYPGFTNATIAGQAAARDLRALSSPLLSCTIIANREAATLNIGDVFKFEYPDYHDGYVVMRVMQIAFGDGKKNQIKITCTEDIYSLPTSSQLGAEESGWTDVIVSPTASDYLAVDEAPYYELVQQQGQSPIDDLLSSNNDVGYIVGTASRSDGAINAIMSVDDGSGYEDANIVEFCPYGLLSSALTKTATSVTLTSFESLDSVVLGTHAKIDDEIVVITALNTTTGVATIGRGALDTVPTTHTASTPVMFWDYYLESDGTEYVSSDDIDVKIRPTTGAGTLDLADATPANVILSSRAFRPYPPGNLKFNSVAYPETISGQLTLTWSHRDRTQQTSGTIYDTTHGNIGPEATTTYTIKFYNEEDTLVRTETGLTGTSYTYLTANEADDSGFSSGSATLYTDIATLSPQFWWKMDESSGNFTDSAGSNTAIAQGTITYAQTIYTIAAVTLDGSTGRAYTSNTEANPQNFTIFALINATSGCIIGFGDSQTGTPSSWDRLFYIGTDNKLYFGIYSGGLRTISYALSAGEHSVACSVGSAGMKLYIDGTLVASDATYTTAASYTGYWRIGEQYLGGGWPSVPGSHYLNGKIGCVTKFNSQLSDTNISDLHAGSQGAGPRINGRLRAQIYSVRNSYDSHQVHDHEVFRLGYGLNYGKYYGGG